MLLKPIEPVAGYAPPPMKLYRFTFYFRARKYVLDIPGDNKSHARKEIKRMGYTGDKISMVSEEEVTEEGQ